MNGTSRRPASGTSATQRIAAIGVTATPNTVSPSKTSNPQPSHAAKRTTDRARGIPQSQARSAALDASREAGRAIVEGVYTVAGRTRQRTEFSA